jgi:hypothetical protein
VAKEGAGLTTLRLLPQLRRTVGFLVVVAVATACGSGDARRKKAPRTEEEAGVPDAGRVPDAGPQPSPEASTPPGPLQYVGSTGPAGGTVMTGGSYILFSVTGEVPGTSALTKSPGHKMVGGVVGRASF